MAKRKINRKNGKADDDEKEIFSLSGDVKRSVLAIFLFALAAIFALGFFDSAGVLGGYLDKIIGLLFGWGKWIFPLVLVLAGIILLFRKETFFYVSKLAGLAVSFLALLGFFHLYFDNTEILSVAKSGEGGGWAGYAISYLLLNFTGTKAGSIILSALFVSGAVIAFNYSIAPLIHKIYKLIVKEKPAFVDEEDVTPAETAEEEKIEEEEKKENGEENIRNLEFVEDPNKVEENKSGLDSAFKKDKKIKWPFGKKKKNGFAVVPLGKTWQLPPLTLLEEATGKGVGGDVDRNAKIIQKTLSNFGIEVELGDIQVGPTVTQYSFRPAVGVKLSRITALNNDLALALAAHPIRIEAPIPGKSLVGIEVPNKSSALVRLKNLLASEIFQKRKSNLTIPMGEDVSGNYIYGNLDTMPHLMIAGATGTGKSVCINSILLSLLYQNSPQDLNLILIDPKRVELSLYNGIPHLLSSVIVENGKVVTALKWAVGEMERRYRLFQDTSARDISSFNQKATAGEHRVYKDPETKEEKREKFSKLSYIVIIIDELADLMSAHGREVEGVIIRLAQMARAVGIHLIVSTQRPSVEVLTGLIKANITTRIAFQVATQIDSRTILDMSGSEKLLGNGDMLYLSASAAKPRRLQGIFVTESEVKKVVNFIKNQKVEKQNEGTFGIAQETSKEETVTDITSPWAGQKINFEEYADSSDDVLYEEAKKLIIKSNKASASLLQRRLRIGYARAARLLDMLEEKGIVGPADGAKPREILVENPNVTNYEDPVEDQEIRDKWQM